MKSNQSPIQNRFPMAHTYSIIARDPSTGQMGVAVQSHWFSVGSVVPWAEAGVGVIATQAIAEVSYGPLGLQYLNNGRHPKETLQLLLHDDDGRDVRQVAILDARGEVAAHTGVNCIGEAGHVVGDQFSVQANMMLKDTVWQAMAAGYKNASGDLADRMLAALEAGQKEGGDVRGMQSAAMVIVEGKKSSTPWQQTTLELRVEDNPRPLEELKRLITIDRAYNWMNRGDSLLADGKTADAFEAYDKAAKLAPEIDELKFWQATTLAGTDRLDEALPIFKHIFEINPNWAVLLRRLPKSGLFKEDPVLMEKITSLVKK